MVGGVVMHDGVVEFVKRRVVDKFSENLRVFDFRESNGVRKFAVAVRDFQNSLCDAVAFSVESFCSPVGRGLRRTRLEEIFQIPEHHQKAVRSAEGRLCVPRRTLQQEQK